MDNLKLRLVERLVLRFAFLLMKWLPEFLIKLYGSRFENRRINTERRKSSPIKRLSFGSWLAYERSTGEGKFNEVSLNPRTRERIEDSLSKEIVKYSFIKKSNGNLVSPSQVLQESVEKTWRCLDQQLVYLNVINIIEKIAEYIGDDYDVRMLERRSQPKAIQLCSTSERLVS